MNGTYTVFPNYRDQKSPEIAVEIMYEGDENPSKFPQWIKNSVRWWAEDKINEYDFILGIQHLIRIGVLNPPSSENQKVEGLEENKSLGVKIPKYVKQNALWWTQDKITDDEFVDGV